MRHPHNRGVLKRFIFRILQSGRFAFVHNLVKDPVHVFVVVECGHSLHELYHVRAVREIPLNDLELNEFLKTADICNRNLVETALSKT